MERTPRHPHLEKMVNSRVLIYSYGYIGQIQMFFCWLMFFHASPGLWNLYVNHISPNDYSDEDALVNTQGMTVYYGSKILLMSEGFQKSDELAKKIVTIFQLMKDQLSKQSHYDFSMRAVKSVLTAAGRIKRESPMLQEIQVIIKAIRDMNLPKFLAEDVILFDNLFIDLFPECDEPEVDTDELQIAIEQSMLKKGLMLDENLVVKVMQLFEAKKTRHGNMLVGATMSGKTKCWEILMDAINRLHQEEKDEGKTEKDDFKWSPVKIEVMNPKAVTTDELYGNFDDQNPPQWCEGVLSTTLK
jgi:dynein heavy chain